jgi:YbgC/YbaW family acyl-CoA thioester hydrolase
MMKPHEYRTQIRERHLDSFGHVNNAQYLVLFEEARWEMITSRGYGLKQVMDNGVGTVILSCSVKFKRELSVRDWIRIDTELVSLEKKIGMIRQHIYRESDGKLAALGEFQMGCFDLKERKLIQPSESWLYAITGERLTIDDFKS